MKVGDKVHLTDKGVHMMRDERHPEVTTALTGEIVKVTGYFHVRFPIDRGDGKPWLMEWFDIAPVEEAAANA